MFEGIVSLLSCQVLHDIAILAIVLYNIYYLSQYNYKIDNYSDCAVDIINTL